MGSNVVCANPDLLKVNDQLYGSTRMAMVTPVITLFAGNERNYSDGDLKNTVVKETTYDLVQRISDGALAELVNAASTELVQANVSASTFEYIRRALIVEIKYSSLESINKNQPRARMLAELMKQFDIASYMGFFSNQGVDNNSKLITQEAKAVSGLDTALAAVRACVEPMKEIGWTKSATNLLTIAYTADIGEKLAGIGAGRDKSDIELLMAEYAGAKWVELPSYLSNGKSRFEVALRPLVTHHHASLPSLYRDYAAPNGMTTTDMFSMETSALEVEEKGALRRQLVTLS